MDPHRPQADGPLPNAPCRGNLGRLGLCLRRILPFPFLFLFALWSLRLSVVLLLFSKQLLILLWPLGIDPPGWEASLSHPRRWRHTSTSCRSLLQWCWQPSSCEGFLFLDGIRSLGCHWSIVGMPSWGCSWFGRVWRFAAWPSGSRGCQNCLLECCCRNASMARGVCLMWFCGRFPGTSL